MKKRLVGVLLLVVFQISVADAQTDSKRGSEIRGPFLWKSKIYPATERSYWVYVPRQYDATKPTCTMVVQDGLSRASGWRLTAVLDSLISLKQVPVTIGIFIDPGKVISHTPENSPRLNRSFEYDALGDRYARFLLEEIIPEVSRSYNLSKDPNDRLIAGASSGAICAFNVAWERPDAFRRVLSTIGTYVGIRGGDEVATLVRKTEAKPLRIFLQDGEQDLNVAAGDWFVANQDMLSALTWAGYEVNHAWGPGGHDNKHTITILAEAIKWLWKDYPAPVQTHKVTIPRFNPLVDDEPWKEVQMNDTKVNKLAINKAGEIYFTSKNFVYKTDYNTNVLFTKLKGLAGGISFNGDGKLYAGDLGQHKIISIDEKGTQLDVASNVDADYLTISAKGIYFSETAKSRIGFYNSSTQSVTYVPVSGSPTGLAISSEQTFLSVGNASGVFGYSFKILNDGSLDAGQDYVHYHIPFGAPSAGVAGMTVDSENLLYSSTSLGIQVSDLQGRVNFIFSKPADRVTDVKLGGPEFNVLYTSCNGRLFSRKVTSTGVLSWLPPMKPGK